MPKICFSFAAYAKSVTSHLRSINVSVTPGLSDPEFSTLESSFGFVFPPDLRSILREGLPVSPGFPNWRNSSDHQLRVLLSYPITSLTNSASKNQRRWQKLFETEPADAVESFVAKVKTILSSAPILVPIYKNFYIPSGSENGNPIFHVKGGAIRLFAFDLSDFFRKICTRGDELPAPAWAAKSARRVETWSDLTDDVEASVMDIWKEMAWRLREGGWREEEVREMVGVGSEMDDDDGFDRTVMKDRNEVMWHVRILAVALLKSGWSKEDVVYCMGSTEEEKERRMTWQGMGPNSLDDGGCVSNTICIEM